MSTNCEDFTERQTNSENLSCISLNEKYREDIDLNGSYRSNKSRSNMINHMLNNSQNQINDDIKSQCFNETFISSFIDNLSSNSSQISWKTTKMNMLYYYGNNKSETINTYNIQEESEKIRKALIYNNIPDIVLKDEKITINDTNRGKNIKFNKEKNYNPRCFDKANNRNNLNLENSNNRINYNINNYNVTNPIIILYPFIYSFSTFPMQEQFNNNYINNPNVCMQNTAMNPQNNYNYTNSPRKKKSYNNYPQENNNAKAKNIRKTDLIQKEKNPENDITELVLEKIKNGTEKRTTIRIKNIPSKFTLLDVEKLLNEVFNYNDKPTLNNNINEKNISSKSRPYDLIYLPPSKKTNSNIGYVFVNLINPKYIVLLYEKLQNEILDIKKKKRKCEISFADVQGKDNSIKSIKNGTTRPIIYNDGEYE